MKSIIALLVITLTLTFTLTATAQTAAKVDTNSDARAKMELDRKAMNDSMQKAIAAAQERARLREAQRLTNPPVQREALTPALPARKPDYYNTNRVAPGMGHMLQLMEKYKPGISTNYTAEQRAATNPITPQQYEALRQSVRTNNSPLEKGKQ